MGVYFEKVQSEEVWAHLAALDVLALHLGDGRLGRRPLHVLHEPAPAPGGDLHVHDLNRIAQKGRKRVKSASNGANALGREAKES